MNGERTRTCGTVVRWGSIVLVWAALWGGLWSRAESGLSPAEALYVQAYDAEQGIGDLEQAVSLYEQARGMAASNSPGLLARISFRIGVCHRRWGHWEEARKEFSALRALPDMDPALRRLVEAEWQDLSARLERVRLRGRVTGVDGAPVPGALVLAGDWDIEAPFLTAADGTFLIECKAVRDEAQGIRYAPIYAEHPDRRLAAVHLGRPGPEAAAEIAIRLAPMIVVTGTVVDSVGRAVEGAEISATAFGGEPSVYVPCDRLLPRVVSGKAGVFRLGPLATGLRWRLAARREGYTLREETEVPADRNGERTPLRITLETPEGVSLTGMVTDESGTPLVAGIEVRRFSPPREALAAVRSGADGRYRVNGLAAEPVAIRVEALAPGYAWREVTGIRPGGARRVDFVLSARPPTEAMAAPGWPAPRLDVQTLNSTPLDLAAAAGDVVALAFWDRSLAAEPAAALARWEQRYAERGLRVWCVHDHSGYPEELLALAGRLHLRYPLAIDRYAPAGAGARNSLGMARYGMAGGGVALIDRQGRVAAMGNLDAEGDAMRLENQVRDLLGLEPLSEESASAGGPPRPVLAPPLRIARWIRRENAVPTADVTLDGLKGRIVVLHFGSAYVDAKLRQSAAGGRVAIEQIARIFGPRGVQVLWILPSGEGNSEVERLVAQSGTDIATGIDDGGQTWRAYGAGGEGKNSVLDRRGRVVVPDCTDSQLLRVVKDLLGDEDPTPR